MCLGAWNLTFSAPNLSSALSQEKPADSTNILGLRPGLEKIRSCASDKRVTSLKEPGSGGKRGRGLVREDGLRKIEEGCRCFRVRHSKTRAKERSQWAERQYMLWYVLGWVKERIKGKHERTDRWGRRRPAPLALPARGRVRMGLDNNHSEQELMGESSPPHHQVHLFFVLPHLFSRTFPLLGYN